jgi:uncharacterized protein (TIGR02246 family)
MALTTDDIVEINQLYSTYGHVLDDGDPDSFAACFTADATLGGVGKPISGHEAFKKFAGRFMATDVRHVISGVLVEGDGDEAHGRAYLVAYIKGVIRSTGRYRDRLVRVDGKWLFADRSFTPDEHDG